MLRVTWAQAYGEFKARKESADASKIDILYAKYGGSQHSSSALASGMVLGASEAYVEYSADGSVLKGAEAAVARSKYDEDVMRFNHTCVWGSFWEKEGRSWGYACCLSTNRNT
jgi:pre-mRNA-processing factor SLU7